MPEEESEQLRPKRGGLRMNPEPKPESRPDEDPYPNRVKIDPFEVSIGDRVPLTLAPQAAAIMVEAQNVVQYELAPGIMVAVNNYGQRRIMVRFSWQEY